METDHHASSLLRVENLKKFFPIRRGFLQRTTGYVKAVDGVNFAIEPGKTLGLVGESGCGKSTVARLLLRLIAPDDGRIVFQQQDISHFSEKDMKPLRRKIQIVFQDPFGSLNPRMTVGQSVMEGIRQTDINGADQRQRLKELLEMVGISAHSADRYPHEFSGGQRQRIGIARALSVNPSLIVCDEPISALDVSIQAQIINLLKDLQDELGVSYLFISHDLNVVGYLCHRVAVMYRGQIMEHADADDIFDTPCHPYTRSLLAAVPGGRAEVSAVTDLADNPCEPGPGCAYRERCPKAGHVCREPTVPLADIGSNHFVRCHRPEKHGQGIP